jgi:hypothetical protein
VTGPQCKSTKLKTPYCVQKYKFFISVLFKLIENLREISSSVSTVTCDSAFPKAISV